MVTLKRTLHTGDGLAMVVGIMVGSGIFRTPGLVALQLGRPGLIFVAWILGGVLAFLGALIFAELATRHPGAGGKYVYAREAYGPRAGFVVGWIEALGIYAAAIAAIAVVCGEFAARIAGLAPGSAKWLGGGFVLLFTCINLAGVASGRWVQNIVTAAKVLALVAVVVVAFAAGTGAGWNTPLPDAPRGVATLGALAVSFQAVIWTYYGYPDAAKIAEEVVDPGRTLPRVLLIAIAVAMGLYLLLNASFLHVLPMDRIAASNFVPGDVAQVIFGARGEIIITLLALLVVVASLNGNVFVTPRVVFGLAREGLAPAPLAWISRGGTPWVATLLVAGVAIGLAVSGTFQRLLSLAVALVFIIDGFVVTTLFRLRRRNPSAPFQVPFYPFVPLLFLTVYAVLLAATVITQPVVAAIALGAVFVTYGLSLVTTRRPAPAPGSESA